MLLRPRLAFVLISCALAATGSTLVAQDVARPRYNNSFVHQDENAKKLKNEATQAAKAEQYARAAQLLDRMLDLAPVGVLPLRGSELYVSPRRWAMIHLLDQSGLFPRDVLAEWRKIRGKQADLELMAAMTAGEEARVLTLLARFPAAPLAPLALLALCDRAMQRGDVESAHGFLLRAPGYVPRSEATAWLASDAYQARARHIEALRQSTSSDRRDGWSTLGGAPHRAARGDALAEPSQLKLRWQTVMLIQDPQHDLPEDPPHSPILPFYPVCDRDQLYVHLGTTVAILNRKTGAVVNYAPEGTESDPDVAEAMLVESPGVRAATIDNGILYFNQLFASKNRLEIATTNRLVAYDVKRKRTIWYTQFDPNHPIPVFRKPIFFRGAPAVVGDRVYVYGAVRAHVDTRPTRSEEAHIFCFDRRRGRLVWHRYLGYGETAAGRKLPPLSGLSPAVRSGVVAVVTGLGVAATLDAATGDILWMLQYDRQQPSERARLTDYEDQRKVYRGSGWMREPPRIVGDAVYFAPFDSDDMFKCWLFGARRPQDPLLVVQWNRRRDGSAPLLEYVGGITRDRIYYVGRRDPFRDIAAYRPVVSHRLDDEASLRFGLIPADIRDPSGARRIPPEIYGRPTLAGDHLIVPTKQRAYRFATLDIAGDPAGSREIPLLPGIPAGVFETGPLENAAAFGNLIAVDGLLYAVTTDRVVCYGPR